MLQRSAFWSHFACFIHPANWSITRFPSVQPFGLCHHLVKLVLRQLSACRGDRLSLCQAILSAARLTPKGTCHGGRIRAVGIPARHRFRDQDGAGWRHISDGRRWVSRWHLGLGCRVAARTPGRCDGGCGFGACGSLAISNALRGHGCRGCRGAPGICAGEGDCFGIESKTLKWSAIDCGWERRAEDWRCRDSGREARLVLCGGDSTTGTLKIKIQRRKTDDGLRGSWGYLSHRTMTKVTHLVASSILRLFRGFLRTRTGMREAK